MSVADKITRLQNAKTAISTAITNMGGTVASGDGYEDFATDIATIPSSSATVTLSSLATSGSFSNTQWTGSAPDTTGITTTASFSASETISSPTTITLSGSGSKAVTPTVTPATWSTTEGSQTATFTYTYNGTTKTATKSVNVYKKLSAITLTTAPTGTQIAGQAIDFTGLKITASYTDGTTSDVTASVTKDKTTWDSSATAQTVTFTYTKNGISKTCTWTATPTVVTLTGLAVSGDWTNAQYVSTAVDTTGLTFTATYSNSSTRTVTPTSMSPSTWSSTVGTQTCTFTYTEGGVSKTCTKDANVQQGSSVDPVLGNNSWATIKAVASAGTASTYWAVGAYKDDTINGTVGTVALNGTYRFVIVGFNHNSSIEGGNTISFMIKDTSGTDIAFVDSKYGSNVSGATNYYSPNTTATNTGGWQACQMRANICGGATDVTVGSNTLLAALPSALQSAIAKSKIYSDNTGGGSDTASYVTTTYDKIYLPSEYEIQGARSYANSAEQNYQAQFQYYINGNSKVRYRHSATTSTARWWCRSVYSGSSGFFCGVDAGGSAYPYYGADGSRGFAPCFKIGADAA